MLQSQGSNLPGQFNDKGDILMDLVGFLAVLALLAVDILLVPVVGILVFWALAVMAENIGKAIRGLWQRLRKK